MKCADSSGRSYTYTYYVYEEMFELIVADKCTFMLLKIPKNL